MELEVVLWLVRIVLLYGSLDVFFMEGVLLIFMLELLFIWVFVIEFEFWGWIWFCGDLLLDWNLENCKGILIIYKVKKNRVDCNLLDFSINIKDVKLFNKMYIDVLEFGEFMLFCINFWLWWMNFSRFLFWNFVFGYIR